MDDQIKTIFQAIKFIESNLQNEITVARIAEAVGYSLFHFIRTFNRIVQHTPYDYLIRRRLSEAARLLVISDRRIIDISQDFQFNNQENFSRSFKRMFEMQPSQWREFKPECPLKIMPPKTLLDLQFINQESFQYPVLEDSEMKRFYGLMTALKPDDPDQMEQRKQLWMDFCKLIGFIPSMYTTITTYLNQNRDHAYFFLGIEKSDRVASLPIMIQQELPASRYVKMRYSENDRRLALNYLYSTWFPKTDVRPFGQVEIEFRSKEDQSTGMESICIPVKDS